MKIRLIGLNARYSHSCLALFYLRNELEKHVPEAVCEICQFTINDPYYALLQRLAAGEPDCLFFSSLIWNSDLVERLVIDLLSVDERLRIVVGGPQAEIVGCSCGAHDRLTIFCGDIEAADPTFYIDLQRGNLQATYRASFLQSTGRALDYPYRDEDFTLHLRNRAVYYESSRGCPFFCSYCLSSSEKGLFHKDLDQVFSELDHILSHSPETVRFVDRTFNDNTDRALAIWCYLADRDPDALFHFEIAPDRFTEQMFDFLAQV
ncbi:MAG: Mg-protoporphyrin IX monomethyl ester oxidative cyclase, partial [Desulfobulbaceae bacterium]